MIRAEFIQRNEGRALKLEGRLAGAWAVQGKSLLSRHFVSNGLLVHAPEVKCVHSVGEQLLVWLHDVHAKFVTDTWYAGNVCENLQLDLQRKSGVDELFLPTINVLPC